jgi:hypothetical protein
MPHTILHKVGELDAAPRTEIPLFRWTLLLAVAVGGSILYGASLSLVVPGWRVGGAALWLTLSAGFAWCVFIPALWFATRLPLRRCLDACLLTMGGGEVVLASGALVNALLWWRDLSGNGALMNALVVGVSNIAMAALLALQLRRVGVTVTRTLTLWMVALNGSGTVFFALLLPWFRGS